MKFHYSNSNINLIKIFGFATKSDYNFSNDCIAMTDGNFSENWFAAVILKHSKKKVVVPIKWVGSLDLLQIFNIGVSHTKDHNIFYSPNPNDEPNFAAEIKQSFDENASFCYDGKVLHIWG